MAGKLEIADGDRHSYSPLGLADGPVDDDGKPWYPLLPLGQYYRPHVVLILALFVACHGMVFISGSRAPSIYDRWLNPIKWRNPPAADKLMQQCYEVGWAGALGIIFYVGGLMVQEGSCGHTQALHGKLPSWFPKAIGITAVVVSFASVFMIGPLGMVPTQCILLSIFVPFVLCNSGRRCLAANAWFLFWMQFGTIMCMAALNNFLQMYPAILKPQVFPFCSFLYKQVCPIFVNIWWWLLRGDAPGEIYSGLRAIISDTSEAIAIAGLLLNVKDNLATMTPTWAFLQALQSVISNCLLKALSDATGASLLDVVRRILCGRPLPKPKVKKEIASRYFLIQGYTPALFFGPYWILAALAYTNDTSFAYTSWVPWAALLVNTSIDLFSDTFVVASRRAKLSPEQQKGLVSTWQMLQGQHETHCDIDVAGAFIPYVEICGAVCMLGASAWPLGNYGDTIMQNWFSDTVGWFGATSSR